LGLRSSPCAATPTSCEREIREYLRPVIAAGGVYAALYLGDFDSSGDDIERNARRYLGDLFDSWRRVAITLAVIETFTLPEDPGRQPTLERGNSPRGTGGSSRSRSKRSIPTTCALRSRTRSYANWDTSAHEAVLALEQHERALLRHLAEAQP